MKFNEFFKFILESETGEWIQVNKTILFTDIESSSKMWQDDGKAMMEALDKHEDQVVGIVNKFNAELIKSIGDSYMISFDELSEAIQFAIDLQNDISENPISVKNTPLHIRIGICAGDVYEKIVERQEAELIDYFGCTVNIASRMESKVSDVGGLAFASKKPIDVKKIKVLQDYNLETIEYKVDCVMNDRHRSERLLTDMHNYMCKDVEELGGVPELTVYKLKV